MLKPLKRSAPSTFPSRHVIARIDIAPKRRLVVSLDGHHVDIRLAEDIAHGAYVSTGHGVGVPIEHIPELLTALASAMEVAA